MVKILFIEDIPDSLTRLIAEMRKNLGVECVKLWDPQSKDERQHATGEQLFGAACKLFNSDLTLIFDLVCFDINLNHHSLGGIRLFNRMAQEGFRSRWRNTAVLSGHVKQGFNWWDDVFSEENHDPIGFAIALWADTVPIPNRHLVPKHLALGNTEKYAQLLLDIAKLRG